MNIDTIWEGIIIGAAGGSIAGISVWIISILREKVSERNHKQRIYDWLYNKTKEYQRIRKIIQFKVLKPFRENPTIIL